MWDGTGWKKAPDASKKLGQILLGGSGDETRVTGIGGIFFKSDDEETLYQWYEKHLGITRVPEGTGRGSRNILIPAALHS